MTPTLHFIYGLPGAGKTSLGRQLAASSAADLFVEDEYLAARATPITSLDSFFAALREVRAVIAPLAIEALRGGRSVVFDFAGNTVACRAWARSVADAANAALLLHVLDVPLDECKRRVRARNATKPAGLYFGDVSDELFDQVVPFIVPVTDAEGIQAMRTIAPA